MNGLTQVMQKEVVDLYDEFIFLFIISMIICYYLVKNSKYILVFEEHLGHLEAADVF